MTYTYDDIVTAKDILTGKVKEEDIIGKMGWFSDYIVDLPDCAGSRRDKLEEIASHADYPFKEKGGTYWRYFLPEKEAEYVPFDLSDPKDRDFLRGKWVKTKQTESESQISSFKYTKGYGWRAYIPSIGFTTGEDLLEELTFLDSSVIGKPANGQQMR